jgi:hypothetical protein
MVSWVGWLMAQAALWGTDVGERMIIIVSINKLAQGSHVANIIIYTAYQCIP